MQSAQSLVVVAGVGSVGFLLYRMILCEDDEWEWEMVRNTQVRGWAGGAG